MRVKQPEPFDQNREYSPGERCVCRGMVLIHKGSGKKNGNKKYNGYPML